MAGKEFTEYVIDKATDVAYLDEEMATELANLAGPVSAFIDDAVAAYREYILSLVASTDAA
jgi:hypothetical protein